MIEILKVAEKYNPSLKEQFINLALENITKGNQIYYSLVFLQNLLSTYPNESPLPSGSRQQSRQTPKQPEQTVEHMVSKILSVVDIFELVIKQAANYMTSDLKTQSAITHED